MIQPATDYRLFAPGVCFGRIGTYELLAVDGSNA